MPAVSWLHLSDWHQDGAQFDTDRRVVLDALLRDIDQRRRLDPDLAALDFVFFTGDLTAHGDPAEFVAARDAFLGPVLVAAGVDKSRLFLIPGNQDVDKALVQKLRPASLTYPFASKEDAQAWLDDDGRETLLRPLREFEKFVAGYGCAGFGAYGGSATVTTASGVPVGIVGVNSALFAGYCENDYGNLLIGEEPVYDRTRAIADAALRIGLIHHPLEWLIGWDRAVVRQRLTEGCHLLLQGYEGAQSIESLAGTEGEALIVTAGTSYGGRESSGNRYNAYNLVVCDTESRRGKVFLRRWADGDREWSADRRRRHPDGVYAFGGRQSDDSSTPTIPRPSAPTALQRALLPPRPPEPFIRDIGAMVGELLEDHHLLIWGEPGMGKSSVTQAISWDPAVEAHFQDARFWVDLANATSEALIWQAIIHALGLAFEGEVSAAVTSRLRALPAALLVLDNLETPLSHDEAATGRIVDTLAPFASLVASTRGDVRPGELRWRRHYVQPPPLRAACEIFAASAEVERWRSFPETERLVTAVDCVPLAAELLGMQARDLGSPKLLWTEWTRQGLGLLGDWKTALEFSVKSPRMTPDALRLARIFGWLPGGIAIDDVGHLLPEGAIAAAATLRKLGLIHSADAETRWRMLHPVREYVRGTYPPEEADQRRIEEYCIDLITQEGEKIGREGGGAAIARLALEIDNIAQALLTGLKSDAPWRLLVPLSNYGAFVSVTNLGDLLPLEEAARFPDERNQAGLMNRTRAECNLRLGEIYLGRSNLDQASDYYNRALTIFHEVGDRIGEANCIQSLGDVYESQSQLGQARDYYNQALPVLQEVGERIGEANCIKSLGDIHLSLSEWSQARDCYNQALTIYQEVGGKFGEANSLRSLGDMHLSLSEWSQARDYYHQALTIYQEAGAKHGEATSIYRLGDVALFLRDFLEARRFYAEALPRFKEVSSVVGIGNVTKGLGDVAAWEGDTVAAARLFHEALGHYGQSLYPENQAEVWLCLSFLSTDPAVRDERVAKARELLAGVGFTPELIAVFERNCERYRPPADTISAPGSGDTAR